jgi:hypothetical protein
MQTLARHTIGIAVAALLLVGCAPSEAQIQTALQDTQQVEEAIAQAIAATQAAALALIPSDTPIPPTSTDTPTPEVTSTGTPPPGQAYVPDLVGLNIEDAKATCSAADLPFYWVVLINKDVPQFSVYAQTPGPGSLISLDANRNKDRLKLLEGVHEYTPTPPPAKKAGSTSGDPCGGIDYAGICSGNTALWCDGGQLWYWDCAAYCGGYCGWDPAQGNTCFCP